MTTGRCSSQHKKRPNGGSRVSEGEVTLRSMNGKDNEEAMGSRLDILNGRTRHNRFRKTVSQMRVEEDKLTQVAIAEFRCGEGNKARVSARMCVTG